MTVKTIIKPSEYHDSVSLMLAARELCGLPGVVDAAVLMATEANKGLLKNSGLLTPEAEVAGPNDLVIAISGPESVLDAALAEAEKLLNKRQAEGPAAGYRTRTIAGAVKANPAANLAVISVAGRYAAAEAWEALYGGLHVLLFSDNVSLEDEIALKRYAVEHGLLMMGPGAGTAIINGVALGFANVLPPGPVGIVSAAGTGLQEVSTLLARSGVGISQGIGTGGRDLKEEVGGLMMLAGLRALQADPATQVIVLISKPPAASVAQAVLNQALRCEKPAIVCFLGSGQGSFSGLIDQGRHVKLACTLEETAQMAAQAAAPQGQTLPAVRDAETIVLSKLRSQLQPAQKYLRGLFSGGTLCYEAQVIWRDLLAQPVYSNAPLEPANRLADSLHSQGHTAIDLGEEEFTVGRPHPMIDNDLRIRRLLQEARDPETAVIVLDVVLGYGAHPDPAAELAPAICRAQQLAREAGRGLAVVAAISGTQGDPQNLDRQASRLAEAGAIICPSNASAARAAAAILA